MLLVGCEYQQSTAGTSGHDEAAPILPLVIDAGVVIADRGGYLCLPLDRFSLKRDEHPIDVTSSCECIQPSLVTYATPGGSRELALLLEFAADPGSGAAKLDGNSAVKLAVTVSFTLSNGGKRELSVRMIHAAIASPEVMQKEA